MLWLNQSIQNFLDNNDHTTYAGIILFSELGVAIILASAFALKSKYQQPLIINDALEQPETPADLFRAYLLESLDTSISMMNIAFIIQYTNALKDSPVTEYFIPLLAASGFLFTFSSRLITQIIRENCAPVSTIPKLEIYHHAINGFNNLINGAVFPFYLTSFTYIVAKYGPYHRGDIPPLLFFGGMMAPAVVIFGGRHAHHDYLAIKKCLAQWQRLAQRGTENEALLEAQHVEASVLSINADSAHESTQSQDELAAISDADAINENDLSSSYHSAKSAASLMVAVGSFRTSSPSLDSDEDAIYEPISAPLASLADNSL